MTDYEKELLADLESSDDEETVGPSIVDQPGKKEQEEEQEEAEEEEEKVKQKVGDTDQIRDDQNTFQEKLTNLITSSSTTSPFQTILQHPDIESVQDFKSLSKIYPLIEELKSKLNQYSNDEENDFLQLLAEINKEDNFQSDEYKFIVTINELTELINNEIFAFVILLKMQYKLVFPELESIIINNIDYVQIVMMIKQDLAGIQKYEQDLRNLVTNDKVLVVIMSALQQSKDHFQLSDADMHKVLLCGELVLELNNLLELLSNFISHKLVKFAPNVAAIIGPITTSQLLIATGSLRQLAVTPSCNIASLGVRDLSSNTRVASRNIRQTGYIYHSDIVKYLPPEIQRSAMRIISGKIILAARIDLSKSTPDGSLGTKLRREIEEKIDKLLAPPEQTPDKALPAPIEIKSKKRGGRRLRKMKERFQMSELRKAQNKMEFGKQEDTVTDDYGEEIGLGMSRSGGGLGMGRIGQIQVNKNTDARMSKAMVERLQKQKQKQQEQDTRKSIMDEDFDSIILGRADREEEEQEQEEVHESSNGKFTAATVSPTASGTKKESRWFTGSLKRKNEDNHVVANESFDGNNKRHKLI